MIEGLKQVDMRDVVDCVPVPTGQQIPELPWNHLLRCWVDFPSLGDGNGLQIEDHGQILVEDQFQRELW